MINKYLCFLLEKPGITFAWYDKSWYEEFFLI